MANDQNKQESSRLRRKNKPDKDKDSAPAPAPHFPPAVDGGGGGGGGGGGPPPPPGGGGGPPPPLSPLPIGADAAPPGTPPAGTPPPEAVNKPLGFQSSSTSVGLSSTITFRSGGQASLVSTTTFGPNSFSSPIAESAIKSNDLPSSSSFSINATPSSTVVSDNSSAAASRTINIAAITGAILAALFILVAIRVLYAMFRRPRRPPVETSGVAYPFSPQFQPSFHSYSSPSMDTTSSPVSVDLASLRH